MVLINIVFVVVVMVVVVTMVVIVRRQMRGRRDGALLRLLREICCGQWLTLCIHGYFKYARTTSMSSSAPFSRSA